MDTSWPVSSLPPGWHSRFPNGYRLPSDRLPFILQTSAFWNSCGRKMCSAVEEAKHNVQTPSIHIALQPSLYLLTTQIITNPTTTKTKFQGTSSFMRHTSMQWCLLRLVRMSVAKPVTLAARKCNNAKRKPELNRMKFRRGLSRGCKLVLPIQLCHVSFGQFFINPYVWKNACHQRAV